MRRTALLTLAAGAALAVMATARRWDVVEVRGRSMAPTLLPGDRLLVARVRQVEAGDVVLATDPREASRELVKRVARIGAGGVILSGDNPAFSTDARAFGGIPASAVRWRVLGRYWPPSRIGRIGPRPEAFVPVDEGGEPACAFPEALIAGGSTAD